MATRLHEPECYVMDKNWVAVLKVKVTGLCTATNLVSASFVCLWQEIFTRLCELDYKGLSYILEAASLTRLFDCMAMLLAHPLQRPLQRQADYHIASTPPTDEQTV